MYSFSGNYTVLIFNITWYEESVVWKLVKFPISMQKMICKFSRIYSINEREIVAAKFDSKVLQNI